MGESLLIKVCGMRDAENIRSVEALGIDMMGFVFYEPSPRNCASVPAYLPESAKRVGVFVDSPLAFIEEQAAAFRLHAVQLHGSESPQICDEVARLGVKVIKAFSLSAVGDLEQVEPYEGHCSMYVFDTKTPERGGSGQQFDWNILKEYKGITPFLLSGGIGKNSAASVRAFRHPQLAGIDLNSRFEDAPGLKNVAALRQFIEEIRNTNR